MKLGLVALLALSGCGPCFYQQLVFVTDEAGRPIEGAGVTAISPSFGVGPHRTNAAGVAPLPSTGLFGTLWVSVHAEGFLGESVDVPKTWPLEIQLRSKP